MMRARHALSLTEDARAHAGKRDPLKRVMTATLTSLESSQWTTQRFRKAQNAPPAFHLLAEPTGAVRNLDCSYCSVLAEEMLNPGSRLRTGRG